MYVKKTSNVIFNHLSGKLGFDQTLSDIPRNKALKDTVALTATGATQKC